MSANQPNRPITIQDLLHMWGRNGVTVAVFLMTGKSLVGKIIGLQSNIIKIDSTNGEFYYIPIQNIEFYSIVKGSEPEAPSAPSIPLS